MVIKPARRLMSHLTSAIKAAKKMPWQKVYFTRSKRRKEVTSTIQFALFAGLLDKLYLTITGDKKPRGSPLSLTLDKVNEMGRDWNYFKQFSRKAMDGYFKELTKITRI